jgi:transcription antitermination factor NusG
VVYQIGDKLAPMVRDVAPAPGGERWYVVRVHATDEATAGAFLEKSGFGVYSPKTRIFRAMRRKELSRKQRHSATGFKKPVIIPIYPGYLFLHFDMKRSDWHRTFDFLGIAGMVCHGDLPAIIDDAEIARVKSLEGFDGVIPGGVPAQQVVFNVGERVRITEGSFRSFDGVVEQLPAEMSEILKTHTIEELDDSFRVRVAVLMFGRLTPVDLPLSFVQKI